MPKEEEKPMSEKLVMFKMMLIAGVSVVVLIMGYSAFSTIHTDQTAIRKAQIESSVDAKETAQAKSLEAKALADRAMFDQMSAKEAAQAKTAEAKALVDKAMFEQMAKK